MNKNFIWFVLLSGIVMLGTSMYFSIIGISSLFAGRRFFSGLLAGAMEFSKIIMTSHLTRNWEIEKKFKKGIFVFFIGTLILFSSIGIYSYLADSYQMTTHKIKVVDVEMATFKMEEKILTEEKIDLQNANANMDNEITNIRNMNSELINQRLKLQEAMNADTTGTVDWYGSISRCNRDINTNNKELNNYREIKKTNVARLSEINNELKTLWKDSNIVETSDVSVNSGPLRVLSNLFNVDMGVIVRWLLILIVAIFDPIGVILIITFNQLQKNNKKDFTSFKKMIKHNIDDDKKEEPIIKDLPKEESQEQDDEEILILDKREIIETINEDIEELINETNLYKPEEQEEVKEAPKENIYNEIVQSKVEEINVKEEAKNIQPQHKVKVYTDSDGGLRIK